MSDRIGDGIQHVEHGDAFELLSELPDDSGHACVVDYPWKFDQQNGTDRFGYQEKGDSVFHMESSERLGELFDELSRVLVDGAWLICMADDDFQEPVRDALRASEFTFRRNWAWTPKSMGMGYYGRVGHYPIPVATNGDTERYVCDRSTLFEIPGGRDTDYPTGKPDELYRQVLASPVLRDGERLLEPFCGGGAGAAVANERGSDYWGCDLSETAVSLTRERFNQPTVKQSTL